MSKTNREYNYNYETINAKEETKNRFDDLRDCSQDEFLTVLMDIYEAQEQLDRELLRTTSELNRLLDQINSGDDV